MNLKDRELLQDFLDLIVAYIQNNPLENDAVVNYYNYQALEKKFDTNINAQGLSEKDLLATVEAYLQYAVRTIHPQFFGKSYGAYTVPSLIGEILSAVTNTSIATYVGAPSATVLENALIQKMTQLVGFHNGDGIFLTGGTQANLVALLCARNKVLPLVKQQGLQQNNLVFFISDQAHYSFISAANILGIGIDNLVRVPANEQGQMDVLALEEAIITAINQGKTPFFVAATSGTTVLGAFDPIDKIAAVTSKYNLWLHVDAAYGGSFILSDRCQSWFDGSELADSFAWDAHKLMGIPLPCSVILTKNKGVLYEGCTTCDVSKASSYIFHQYDEAAYDLGKKSLQCTRKVDVLKLWLAWKYYGDGGYGERMDRLLQLAEYTEQRIQALPFLELVFPRMSVNLCFRYRSPSVTNIDDFNRILRNDLIQQGKPFLNYSTFRGQGFLRINIINPDCEEYDIDDALETIVTEAKAQDESQ